MNKRFLNKNINSSLLKQSLPENVLQKSRSRGQLKDTKLVSDYNLKTSERIWRPNALRSSKLDRIKQAEMQIVRKFLQKKLEMIGLQDEKKLTTALQSKTVQNLFCNSLQNLTLNVDIDNHGEARKALSDSNTSIPVKTTRLRAQQQDKEKFFPSSSVFCLRSKKKESQLCLVAKELVEGNFFLLLSIDQIRSMLVAKRIERQSPSELRDRLLESRKIRFLYGGLSKRELEKSIKKARQLLGSTADNLLIVLESRLDVVLERCGFFSSIPLARQSVVHKRVQVNGKAVNMPGFFLQPGDVIQMKLLKNCSIGAKTLKSNDARDAKLPKQSKAMLAKVSKLWGGHFVPFCAEKKNVQLRSPVHRKATKGIQESKIEHHMHSLTFYSLLQLECLFSSICLQKNENGLGGAHACACNTSIAKLCLLQHGQLPEKEMLTHRQLSRCMKDLSQFLPVAQPSSFLRRLKGGSSDLSLKRASSSKFNLHWRTRLALRRLHLDKKVFLRLNMLIKASELYLATQNKANFSHLFVKEFAANPDLTKNSTFGATLGLKALNNVFKSATTHLNLHIQQIVHQQRIIFTNTCIASLCEHLRCSQNTPITKNTSQPDCTYSTQKTENCIVPTSKLLHYSCPKKEKENSVGFAKDNQEFSKFDKIPAFCFDDTFYHAYFYWLQLTKRLLPRDVGVCVRACDTTKSHRATYVFAAQKQAFAQNLLPTKNQIVSFQHRKTKPLHLEVSYQSCNAIFLYPPQRIYLSALVNVDLLVKVS